MTDRKIITVWERWNEKEGQWEHNHIQDGYNEDETAPPPLNDTQGKAWANLKWRKQKGYLEGCKVVLA